MVIADLLVSNPFDKSNKNSTINVEKSLPATNISSSLTKAGGYYFNLIVEISPCYVYFTLGALVPLLIFLIMQ